MARHNDEVHYFGCSISCTNAARVQLLRWYSPCFFHGVEGSNSHLHAAKLIFHTGSIFARVCTMEQDNDALYKGTLIAFMSWRDEEDNENDHEFTQEQLAAVTASEVAGWFNYKVYGTPTPGRNDRPTQGRANSLLHYKKSLSWFMPNRNHTWNELTNVGNPT